MADEPIDYNELDAVLNGTEELNEAPIEFDLTPDEKAALDQEAEAEIKYGDRELEAALTGAASGISLGLSDQILSPILGKERMREVRERSPISSGIGEVGGFVTGLLASGGTSALGAGAKVAVGAGKLASKAATKALQKTVADTARKSLAKEVLKKGIIKGAEGAGEGAVIGLGQAISEDALGQANFNAENVIANIGSGALIGGGLGGLFGATSATVPAVKKGLSPISQKAKKVASNFVDPEEAAKALVGMSVATEKRLAKYSPNFIKELPDYIRTELKPSLLPNPEALHKANLGVLEDSGQKIGKIIDSLEVELKGMPPYPKSRISIMEDLNRLIKEEFKELRIAPSSNLKELKILQRFRNDLAEFAGRPGNPSFKELDQLRRNYQKKAYRANRKGNTFQADIADKLRGAIRQEQDSFAQWLSASSAKPEVQKLAQDLQIQNKRYHTASTIRDSLESKSIKEGRGSGIKFRDLMEVIAFTGIGGPKALLAAAVPKFLRSDASKTLAILSDVEKSNQAINQRLKTSINNFVKGTKRAIRPASTAVLMNSGFALSPEKKEKPKTKQDAYQNVKRNIDELKNDPQKLIDRLAKTTFKISMAAPATAQQMQFTLQRSLDFLDSKLPRDSSGSFSNELFGKEYQPSTLELAKFERYLQAVESPMSVLEDLEEGRATREQVEAIKFVYPDLYARMQSQILEKIMENPKAFSYQKRLQLGVLLDVPTDEALLPQNIQALQANFAAREERQQQTAVKPTVTGIGKLEIAGRRDTPLQETITRK